MYVLKEIYEKIAYSGTIRSTFFYVSLIEIYDDSSVMSTEQSVIND